MALEQIKSISIRDYLGAKGIKPQRERAGRAMYPSPTIDTAVLNSVANLRRAIPFLETHRTIHAFLDNDEAGRKTLADLRELLPDSEVVDQSPFYRNHKDLNDYWREQAVAKIKRPAPTNTDPTTPQNRIEQTNAAVQVRRSMSAMPVKKRGRGI